MFLFCTELLFIYESSWLLPDLLHPLKTHSSRNVHRHKQALILGQSVKENQHYSTLQTWPCKQGGDRVVCECLCVLSFRLARSRHRLTGKASGFYLFINLPGTGNERQGQYTLYTCAYKHTHTHKISPPIDLYTANTFLGYFC